MAKHRRRGPLTGAAKAAKHAPKACKLQLSRCMTGGGRRKAGPCMRQFQRCRTGR
jgi:hypothetical protein